MIVLLTTICRRRAALLEVAQAASNSPDGHYSLALFSDVTQRLCRAVVDYIGCNARSVLHSNSGQPGQRKDLLQPGFGDVVAIGHRCTADLVLIQAFSNGQSAFPGLALLISTGHSI